ncbi:hypothetical protein X801_03563 [Opisthorchis viverrini]|uniref:Uncharacterized protein n=1 Tax=Opisthorchis viverrini TaxID=6198 RepID=A0A1S8X1F9_OPIVI|nr:hypothetical protein X801_03563 [Opisthorchis viverrini]
MPHLERLLKLLFHKFVEGGRYEERVNAFLRGIGSRGSGRRSCTRSRSRSGSLTPSPRARGQRQDFYRRSPYSRSRSPSDELRPHSGDRERRIEDDRYYRRTPPRYDSPQRYGGRELSRSRSPRGAPSDEDYWRREPPRGVHPSEHTERHRRSQDSRYPRRRDISPRQVPANGGRSYPPPNRRYR